MDDEYDYMMAEAEAAAEEEAVSGLVMHRLSREPLQLCMPLAMSAATHEGSPEAVRIAAVRALGRFMHCNEGSAEHAMPMLVDLASGRGTTGQAGLGQAGLGAAPSQEGEADEPRMAQAQCTGLRCAATLVFSSLVPAFPALAEPHVPRGLRDALRREQPTELRVAALSALSDLLIRRKLQASTELPGVLPLLTDNADELSSRASTCIGTKPG